MNRDELIQELRNLAGAYLGKKLYIDSDDKFLGEEIGLRGGDSIQFLDEVEQSFSISLEPLLQRRARRENPNLIQKLLGISLKEHSDFTLNELADYIMGLR